MGGWVHTETVYLFIATLKCLCISLMASFSSPLWEVPITNRLGLGGYPVFVTLVREIP